MSSAKVDHSTAERTLAGWRIERSRGSTGARPGGRSGVPDDALDALVIVLDEIRLGRSRSRAELVDSTGLGRGVVAQRVGELLDRGLVVEGDVGPEHRRPTTAPAVVPIGCRAHPGGRPGCHEHRCRGDHARRAGSSPITPRRPTSGPARRCAWHAWMRCSDSSMPADNDLPGRLWGVGIAVPGPVEFRTGRPPRRPSCPAGTATPSGSDSRRDTSRRCGWTTTSTRWRSASGAPGSRSPTTTSWSSRSAPGSVRASSPRGASIGVPRAAPVTLATSRSWMTRTVICRCGNVGCLEALAGGAAPRPGRGVGGARGSERASWRARWIESGAHHRRGRGLGRRARRRGRGRVAPGRRADASGRCSRASSTSSTRRSSSSGAAWPRAATSSWPPSARRSTAGRCRSRPGTWSSRAPRWGAGQRHRRFLDGRRPAVPARLAGDLDGRSASPRDARGRPRGDRLGGPGCRPRESAPLSCSGGATLCAWRPIHG